MRRLLCLFACLAALAAFPAAAADRALIDAAAEGRAEMLDRDLQNGAEAIRFRITGDPVLIGAILWRDGVRAYPVEDTLSHVSEDRVLRNLPELETIRAAAAPSAWAEIGLSPERLAWCSSAQPTCLLLDRAGLAAELGLDAEVLTTLLFAGPAPRPVWPFLLAGALTVCIAGGLVWIGLNRRTAVTTEAEEMFRIGDVQVFPRRMVAARGDVQADLSVRDLTLLRHLAENPDAVLSKDELYDIGWGRDYMPNSRALDQHIANLRRKLDPDRTRPPVIETVHGRGYRAHS